MGGRRDLGDDRRPGGLADFEARAANQEVAADFDWSNVGNLGIYTYLLSHRPDVAAATPRSSRR